MDNYWQKQYQLLPNEYFVSQDTAWTTITISVASGGHSPFQIKQEALDRDSLQSWAQTGSLKQDRGAKGKVLFRCLVVTTHDYNDFPIDIDRDDLAHVASSLGVLPAHVTMLFAGYTGHSILENSVHWYYGRPGLRAVAMADVSTETTNAIVTVNGTLKNLFIQDIESFSSYADHPLMLVLAIRAYTLHEIHQVFSQLVLSLRKAETLTGFATDDDNVTTDNKSSIGSHTPSPVDLALLTRRVGSSASNLGNLKIILAALQSIKSMLHATSGETTWQRHFKSHSPSCYAERSKEIVETDAVFDSRRQGLLESMVEYQDRARNLQSVIFNLIAKEDANASIALANDSRTIAKAARYDGMSMKTVAVMTMIFLPATFYAALFAVPLLQWQQSPVIQSGFWIYWAFTIPSTIIILVAWKIFVDRQITQDKNNGNPSKRHGHEKRASSLAKFGKLLQPRSARLPVHRGKAAQSSL